MKRLVIATLAALAIAPAASADTRAVSNFDAIEVAGSVDVDVTIGPQFSVSVDGPRADRTITRVNNGVLEIELRGRMFESFGPGRGAHVRVTMPSVSGLDAAAGSEINARALQAGALSLEASSGAHIDVAGTCGALSVDVSSGANIDAANLRCESAQIDSSSGANATVYASGDVSVDGSSGSDIRIVGGGRLRQVALSSGAEVHQ